MVDSQFWPLWFVRGNPHHISPHQEYVCSAGYVGPGGLEEEVRQDYLDRAGAKIFLKQCLSYDVTCNTVTAAKREPWFLFIHQLLYNIHM